MIRAPINSEGTGNMLWYLGIQAQLKSQYKLNLCGDNSNPAVRKDSIDLSNVDMYNRALYLRRLPKHIRVFSRS